ncbi:MCP four helix bundle domain-containing protein [Pantoea stewartii]|uniref:MCP four helix bundle domain-containing protein n=1 Tax=Pantoea stewartii TaxID=66269 RepID=UPI0021D4EB79|nr:MCP four helix bundle domain-containing protein [Pantoea stewartii]MCU7367588.1 MCP four helix bundle domain-containing protein [Pantoea stewartii]
MTITQRLFLTFSLLTASLVTLTLTSVLVVTGFQDRFQFMQLNVMPSIIILDKIVNDSNRISNWSYRYLLITDKQKRNDIKKTIFNYINSVKKQNTYYLDNYVANQEDKSRLLNELKLISKIESQLPSFMSDADKGNNESALSALQSNMGYGETIRELISAYQSHIKFNVEIGKAFSEKNTKIYKTTLWSLLLCSFSVTLILGSLLLRQLWESVNTCSECVAQWKV